MRPEQATRPFRRACVNSRIQAPCPSSTKQVTTGTERDPLGPGGPAAVPSRLGVPLWHELGCGGGRRRCRPKALADRLARAGEQAPGVVAPVTERAPAPPPNSLLRWTKTRRAAAAAAGPRRHCPHSSAAGAGSTVIGSGAPRLGRGSALIAANGYRNRCRILADRRSGQEPDVLNGEPASAAAVDNGGHGWY